MFQARPGKGDMKSLVKFSRPEISGAVPGSICGLEISFSSVPQDVDVKLISDGEAWDAKGY